MKPLTPWEEKWVGRLLLLMPIALVLWMVSLIKAIWDLH